MAEMRGKFISQIQEAYRLKKNAEQEQKSDADAWNQLMNNMVRQMEEQMTQVRLVCNSLTLCRV